MKKIIGAAVFYDAVGRRSSKTIDGRRTNYVTIAQKITYRITL